MMQGKETSHCFSELNVSFGYQCNPNQNITTEENCDLLSNGIQIQDSSFKHRSSSFSCLSGAALSANFTLANTSIYNETYPGLDSPATFRRISSPSLTGIDLMSSSNSSMSTLGSSTSTDGDLLEIRPHLWKSSSVPARVGSSSFLSAMDVQIAGGAAGEDRVQAVCSEENGWLFCGIYDGFNGGDAADFLTGTLYDNIGFYLHMLESRIKKQNQSSGVSFKSNLSLPFSGMDIRDEEVPSKSFRLGVLECLVRAVSQAESDFIYEVEQLMVDRPDIVAVGSCVLTVLLHGRHLYVMNLGDSRAVLATQNVAKNGILQAIQLTEIHTVDNELEYKKIVDDHPDDPSPITDGKVKGRLKLSRAFGVGYLKKKELNNALMGILRVRNLSDPPYVYTHPFTMSHEVSESDLFVVLGSDGLFDFFQNEEIVELVHQFIQENPLGDPAKHLVEQLVLRAAENAGFSTEQLMRVPAGSRRKYHDDVTVIVIILGNKQRTSTATTSL